MRYEPSEAYVRYFWWYMLVALIWGLEFMLAAHQFVIAFATAKVNTFKSQHTRSVIYAVNFLCNLS